MLLTRCSTTALLVVALALTIEAGRTFGSAQRI
jgi:hypothetical protein